MNKTIQKTQTNKNPNQLFSTNLKFRDVADKNENDP